MKILRPSNYRGCTSLLGVVAVLTLSGVSCKAKDEAKKAETETPAKVEDVPATSTPVVPASGIEPASEEERALVKEFLPRFAKIIDASKSDGWEELQSKRQLERLKKDDAVNVSYSAWVVGTKPILEELKTAEFRLERLPNQKLMLTFDSIRVPNDPESVYHMRMVVEDGKILMDED